MNKKTIFIGLGVLAAAGIGIFLYRRNKKGETKSGFVANRFVPNYSEGATVFSADGTEQSSEEEDSSFSNNEIGTPNKFVGFDATTPDQAFNKGITSHWNKLAKQRYGVDGDDDESSFDAQLGDVIVKPMRKYILLGSVTNIPKGSVVTTTKSNASNPSFDGFKYLITNIKTGAKANIGILNSDLKNWFGEYKERQKPTGVIKSINNLELSNADGLDEEFSNIRFKVKVRTQ